MVKTIRNVGAFCLIAIAVSACLNNKNKAKEAASDFSQIKKKGEITAITLSSSISYFIYKGEPMGYEYELLKSFAEANDLKLNIKIAENATRLTEMLEAGEGDLIGYNVAVTNDLKQQLIYCGNESINDQVLIQRNIPKDSVLTDVTDMIGKEIWVVKDSKYYNRLVNLNKELGGGIGIRNIEEDTISVEDLIEMVSSGKIRYTVSDRDIAQINRTYYPNININLKVSHPQRSSWAVRKTSPELANVLNKWFNENKNTLRYQSIMRRYFEMSKMPGDEPVPVFSGKKISPYDELFRKYSTTIGWDWRLLASIAYQESKFNPQAVSWAGATGLMGLMSQTASAYGLNPSERSNPEGNIKTSVKLLRDLDKKFNDFTSQEEKMKFILASYNAGLGHIYDAQALARKLNKDPQVWEGNVEECLKLKSLPEYYNDNVCKYGYLRSTETINYVKNVTKRWKHYQDKIK